MARLRRRHFIQQRKFVDFAESKANNRESKRYELSLKNRRACKNVDTQGILTPTNLSVFQHLQTTVAVPSVNSAGLRF